MSDVNVVVLTGRMTRDVVLKQTHEGTSLIEGSIAVGMWNGTKKEEEASFFDFVLFGRGADSLSSRLLRGTAVTLEGSLRQDRWENAEGQSRSKVKIMARNIRFAGPKKEGQRDDHEADRAADHDPGKDDEYFDDGVIPF